MSTSPQLGQPAGTSYSYATIAVPLEANWELDFWGRVRRQVEARPGPAWRRAPMIWKPPDSPSRRKVVTDYFALRTSESELDILQRSAEAYRRSLELTRNRRAGGIASDLDVSEADTQLRATEADLPAVELQLTRLHNALAALCGQPATTFPLARAVTLSFQVPVTPPSLPSELLERRPDIAAAERRMAAANAEVGVAKTAFYPRVLLNGLAGFQSVSASTLFDWPARFWAVGPTLDLPLFTGGRNRAQLAMARAAYDEAVAHMPMSWRPFRRWKINWPRAGC